MSDKQIEEEDTTLDHSCNSLFDTPYRQTKSACKSVGAFSQVGRLQSKQYEKMVMRFREFQMQSIQKAVNQSSRIHTRYFVGSMVCLLLVLMLLLGYYFQNMSRLQLRVIELQRQDKLLRQDLSQLMQTMIRQRQMLQQLLVSIQNVKQQILDIHLNELIKEERSIHILKKYSNHFQFVPDRSAEWVKGNFVFLYDHQIRKRSEEQLMVFSKDSIPENGIYFMQIEIVETLYGMIAFGVIPQSKRQQQCVYCDSSDIYYIYCSNGNIYNGQYLDLNLDILHKSKPTRFQNISKGDIITMFVDNKQKMVMWYVNNRYAGYESIKGLSEDVYPFVEMTSRGDVITILQ